MNSVVQRRKKTLFGRVVRKIESELAPREEKMISSDVPLDDIRTGDDAAVIELMRDELRAAKHEKKKEW